MASSNRLGPGLPVVEREFHELLFIRHQTLIRIGRLPPSSLGFFPSISFRKGYRKLLVSRRPATEWWIDFLLPFELCLMELVFRHWNVPICTSSSMIPMMSSARRRKMG